MGFEPTGIVSLGAGVQIPFVHAFLDVCVHLPFFSFVYPTHVIELTRLLRRMLHIASDASKLLIIPTV